MSKYLFGIISYIIGRECVERLYFHPSSINSSSLDFSQQNIYDCEIITTKNHCAIRKNNNKKNRCLLISHGNAGNVFSREYLLEKLKNYDGTIYCYEYPGFGSLDKQNISVKNCVKEHIYWIKQLSKKYDKIDLYGESIGGGIVIKTITKLESKLNNKIDNIYLQSTFTSISNVIKDLNILIYYMYKALLKDDLNTLSNLSHSNFINKYIHILHSKDDEIIPYSHSQKNYEKCLELKLNVKFIEIQGGHNNAILNIF